MTSAVLDREEYIEQAYFFRVFRERLDEDLPSQEILSAVHEEILGTTKLPMALDFLKGELMLTGRISDGMGRLSHYFTPFQTFVMGKAEADRARFDQKIALQLLEREAEYRAGTPVSAGLFIYQFESLARNRLGYDRGLSAVAADPQYNQDWKEWILKIRHQLGTSDFADLIYHRSEHFVVERRRRTGREDYQPSAPVLFGAQEGRIARANRGKDPLYLFAALQRHLGYPAVPRQKAAEAEKLPPQLEQRLQRVEQRLQLLEAETKGQLDLSAFYAKPPTFKDPPPDRPGG